MFGTKLVFLFIVMQLTIFVKSNQNNSIQIDELITKIDHQPYYVVPEKSDSDKEFIEILSPKLFDIEKPFDLTSVPDITIECRRDYLLYLKALKSFELWALKLYDANSKFTSGLLSGNVNNIGDFDECLSVENTEYRISGRHCVIELQPNIDTTSPYLNYLRKLAQSFEIIQSNFDDPAHVFSRFSTISRGICVPNACSNIDVELAIKHSVNAFTNNTGLNFNIQVNAGMCQVKNDDNAGFKLERGARITIGLILFVLLISFASTVYDHKQRSDKNLWLTSFSIIRNSHELFTTNRNTDDIKSVHGIRFFNAILIFLCHKSVESLIPKTNRTEMAINSSDTNSIVIRICALYTDAFLMLSGMLVAYSLIGRLKNGRRIEILKEYIGRYIRVMPNIIFVMLVTIYVVPLFAPQSVQRGLVIEKPAQLCKQYGWRNLLMIHNWFRFEDMCNLHTHHIGSDFELFIFAPLLVLLLWKWPKRGAILIISLAVVSSIGRFYVTYTRHLLYFIPFGANLSKLIETASYLYTLPPYRFTVYSIGILLGFVLRKYDDIKLSRIQMTIGWSLCALLNWPVFAMSARMTGIDVKYNPMTHAIFAGFAPIAWCLSLSWIIFKNHLGYKDAFTSFLEWKGFVITTRFCYAFYLIQIPVFQLIIANTKDVRHTTISSIINLNEIFVICLASVFIAVFIETPFINIKKAMFDRRVSVRPKIDENYNNINAKKIQ